MSLAHTMMLYSAIHWLDMADPALRPMAVPDAVLFIIMFLIPPLVSLLLMSSQKYIDLFISFMSGGAQFMY